MIKPARPVNTVVDYSQTEWGTSQFIKEYVKQGYQVKSIIPQPTGGGNWTIMEKYE